MIKYFLFMGLYLTSSTFIYSASGFSSTGSNSLTVNAFRDNNWKIEWTEAIYDELSTDQNHDLLERFINEEDLSRLGCPDYNYATEVEKKDFWVIFIASLVRAESGLNEMAKSPKMRGHQSLGLLQIAPETAMNSCNLVYDEEILVGTENVRCGVKLLNWQLSGAPNKSGKKKRADLENHLFGKRILLWGPLRSQDYRGRKTLYSWFKDHLDQLPFCNL